MEPSSLDSSSGRGGAGLALGFLLVILTGALLTRRYFGAELSAEAVQQTVTNLGWRGPIVFFLMATFRQFLLLPSWVILSAGGLCFGVELGTCLGGAALLTSGAMKFTLARRLGREWLRAQMGTQLERLDRLEKRIDRLGPVVIGLSTAHPFGVLAPFHWGAGLSSIRFAPFLVAIALGAPVRAFVYSTFGAAIGESDSTDLRALAVTISLVALAPLAFPRVRRWLFAGEPAEATAMNSLHVSSRSEA